jgi:hypothetical protein
VTGGSSLYFRELKGYNIEWLSQFENWESASKVEEWSI